MIQYYVYVWVDPKINEPIYVGKGHGRRAYHHLHLNSHLGNVLRKRREEGYTLKPIIVNTVDEAYAFELEKGLIAHLGREDLGTGPLFNLTDGGEGITGLVRSEEHTANWRVSVTQGGKLKLPKSEKHKANLRKPKTEEHKKNLRIPRSEETKAKMRKPKSEETKAKMSEAARLVWLHRKLRR